MIFFDTCYYLYREGQRSKRWTLMNLLNIELTDAEKEPN